MRLGNRHLQNKDWIGAIQAFARGLQESPALGLHFSAQLRLARSAYSQQRSQEIQTDPRSIEVVITGNGKSPWLLEAAKGVNARSIDQPPPAGNLVVGLWERVLRHPADLVLLPDAGIASVVCGLLYKLCWGSRVLATLPPGAVGIDLEIMKRRHGGLPDASDLQAGDWPALGRSLAHDFDACTGGEPGADQISVRDQLQALTDPLRRPRPLSGRQLNLLEGLALELASPLMAERLSHWSQTHINWPALAQEARQPGLISIVIPVYGAPVELDLCLEALRQAHTSINWEVVAVMNDASADTCAVLKRHQERDARIRAIWPGENCQFALGCNRGAAHSSGTVLVFLNNDCRVGDGWLEALVAPLADESVAAVQPRLLKPDGTVQCAGVVFPAGATLGQPLHAGLPGELAHTRRDQNLPAVTGACLAVRSCDFFAIHGFDCRFINSQEDVDLCLRLLQLPGRQHCRCTSAVDVEHSEGRAPGRYSHSRWSRDQFVRRWKHRHPQDQNSVARSGK